MTQWSQVLSDVSLVEFVLLATLTTIQWVRHRIRGAGWVALSFAILGGLSLVVKLDPGLVANQGVAKSLTAALLVMPYCLFRFAASFRRPSPAVRVLAAVLTVAIIAFTLSLEYLPAPGAVPPPHFVAYRAAFAMSFGFLFGYVVLRLVQAGRGEPPVAASRMRLLALAVAGLEVQVVVAALALRGPTVTLATESLTVVMGLLFLVALVLPSFMWVFLSRREDVAFRQALGELVSVKSAQEVADRLLPRVCALVGGSEAALLATDGTVLARFDARGEGDRPRRKARGEDDDPDLCDEDPAVPNGAPRRVVVRTTSGASHALAVSISPFLPYFGSEELSRLNQLADMVGLAIERCELVEQMAYQVSHDGLTGLANRTLLTERLEEAVSHVGRRRASLALLFIDLDRFKLVNDRADHSAGDRVLNEMALRLSAMTRGVDVVARFGGDEFVVFGEVDDEGDALDMAERIRQGLRAPVVLGETHVSVTASIGLVVTSDADTSPATLLRDADNAMYEAKRSGRDQVVLSRTNAWELATRKWGLDSARAVGLSAG